ncbi:MAG: hypothetical protein JST12_12050 [Armatimonadetes bacterium]|nr:hypothetical protein [Armatimonadota bacterium]
MTTLLAAFVLVQAPTVLTRVHSHNDYAQKRPLDEALDNGFSSVEVDVFPVNGKLLVGHNEKDIRDDRTIESMYLDKLSARAKANSGAIYPGSKATFWVLVDVKTKGLEAYNDFKAILDRYPSLKPATSVVRFVISGDRAIDAIAADKGAYAGIDGRFDDLDKGYSFAQMPWISGDWLDSFDWDGTGTIPNDFRLKMEALAMLVHREKRLIRFWGSPDNEATWSVEWKAKVDFLNTDHLAQLARWISKQP